jgi:hypothetical protein
LPREIAANDEPKADLHALPSLLHNVKVSGRRRRSARMTGCAEPLRRHCRGTAREHTEAVPMGRTPEAPSALSACPLAAQDEKETKRPRPSRQDHGNLKLATFAGHPTRTRATKLDPRDRGDRRTENGSSCAA